MPIRRVIFETIVNRTLPGRNVDSSMSSLDGLVSINKNLSLRKTDHFRENSCNDSLIFWHVINSSPCHCERFHSIVIVLNLWLRFLIVRMVVRPNISPVSHPELLSRLTHILF